MFYLHEEAEYLVGTDTWLASDSPSSSFSIVFEDDEETAYFYALNSDNKEQPIVDALHIYNVSDVTDKDIPSKAQLCWHENGLIGLLFINDYPHVIYDFEKKIGYSWKNFPEPAIGSEWKHETLTNEFVENLAK
ncbi:MULTISPECIES: DUF2251 domain-containing protein [unclassified Moraxella]|uniref:DUF2251 domain-containing protein n=1 Tax=unclassified Moraxella TaxID=2685852 RepID=UPI003AF7F98B